MSSPDQLPPHSERSEMGLIGCCILDGRNIVAAFEAGIRDDSFYDLRCRTLWGYLRRMEADGDPVDPVCVDQFLIRNKKADEVGGLAFPFSCVEEAPVASNLGYHLKHVLELWTLRRALRASHQAIQDILQPGATPDRIIADLEERLEEAKMVETAKVRSAKEVCGSWVDRMQQRVEDRANGKEFMGIQSGFHRLDRISSGIPFAAMTVIAARPSVGKTAMLCNLIRNACIDGGTPTTVISLETMHETLMDRMAADFCNIRSAKLRDGEPLTQMEMKAIATFNAKVSKSPLRWSQDVFDSDSICSMIGRHAETGTKLFLIDYIQIVRCSSREERKAYSVGAVATAFKQAALKHKVAVVVLAQLKRVDDENVPPTPNDIADSDQIFRDSDLLWLLHRPDRMNKPDEGAVIVAKNKEGEVGFQPMTYTSQHLRWTEKTEMPAE